MKDTDANVQYPAFYREEIPSEERAVEFIDVSVSYRHTPVLWSVNVSFPKGSLIGVIGPNGAGKSTLLKAAMELVPRTSGRVLFCGQPLDAMRRHISYVPQRESVDWDFPATAFDIALMGRYPHLGLFRRPRKADKERAMECLEQVGMADFAGRQISELSGGQQQRIFLARSLAQEADIYLMDEPFAGVDIASEEVIIDLLSAMRRRGKTIVVVHHDLHSAERYFDRIALLNMRIIAAGPTSKVLQADILQHTYGGKLTLFANVGERIRTENFPFRDH